METTWWAVGGLSTQALIEDSAAPLAVDLAVEQAKSDS